MWRLILSSLAIFYLSGCASLVEKLNDPVIADTTVKLGHNLQKMGDATGFPYAGAGLAAGGMIIYLMFFAKKKASI